MREEDPVRELGVEGLAVRVLRGGRVGRTRIKNSIVCVFTLAKDVTI
jgi:hypothetical protein